MKFSEMKQAVRILADEWDLGKTPSKASGDVCAWIYLLGILAEAEKMIVKKDGSKLMGFCSYVKWKSNNHVIKKRFYHIVEVILMHSPSIKDKKSLVKYYDDYDYTPDEWRDRFDGEIGVIIVDKKYRENGLGEAMIQEAFEYAKNDGAKRLQILTDESCNFKFYEDIGCRKVYEKTMTEQVYIYEKDLTNL